MAIGKPIGNMIIELDLNSAAFSKNLNGAKKAVRSATSEMRNNFKIIDAGGNKLDAMKSKQSGLTKVIEAQENEVAELTKVYEDSFDAQGNATAKTADLARKTNDAKGRLAAYKAQLEETNIRLREMQSKTIAVGKKMQAFGGTMQKVGKQMSSVGKSLTTKVTLPIVGVAAAAIKTGMSFEKSMAKVGAISGATGDDFKKLEDKALEMGSTTKFTASEASEAMTYMSMAGWKTEDMLNGLDGVMNLAAASGEDLAQVSDIVTDGLSAFGLTAKDSGHFSDVLAQAATNANTNVGLMGETFKYVGPVAGALGYSIEDTSLAIGLMASANVKGSKSGTALRNMLTNLAKPTKSMQGVMDELGISLTNSDGSMKSLDEVVDTLRSSFGGLDKAQQANYAATLFGKEAMSGALAIINASDKDYNKLKKSVNGAEGAAKELADTMENNLGGDVNKAKAAIEGLGIKIYKVLEPSLREVTQKVTDFINKIKELSPEQIEMAVKFAAIAAAIGPVLWIGGKLIGTFGSIFNTLGGGLATIGKFIAKSGSLGGALKGIGAVITGPAGIAVLIGVLIAGIAAAYVKFDWFREKVNAVFKFILDEVVKPIMSAMSDFFGAQLKKITDFWNTNGKQIMQAVSNIQGFIKAFLDWIKPAFDFAMSAVKLVIEIVWGAIKRVISGTLDEIMGIIKIFTGLFTGDWKMMWNGIKQLASGAWKAVTSIFGAAISVVSEKVSGFVDKIRLYFSVMKFKLIYTVKAMWLDIRRKFTESIEGVKSKVSDFVERIKQYFSVMKFKVIYTVKAMWLDIQRKFKNSIEAVKRNVSGFVGKVKNSFSDMKSGLISTVKKMWSSITTRFSNSITNLVDKVKGMPQLMGKVLKKSGHFLKDAFVSIWKTAVKAIAKPANLIVGGANWILKRFGSDKEIPDWKPYAKGTDGHKGGHALVNDQKGSTYREAVQLPSGQTFMPKGRNVLLPNLPKGSKVLPAKETQRIYPYKSGIGKWASGIWDKTKAVGSKIKDTALNVWDYVSHPGKLVDKVISNFINYDGINGVALDMGKGLVKKTTGAMKDWAKNLIEEQTAGGGPIDFDGLVRTSKFGWRTHPISGKRKLHGGVDFGGGRGIGHPIKAQAGGKVTHAGRAGTFGNMVRLHQGMYDYIYAHLSKVLVRNGQNVAAGKLVGLMGSTGNSTGPHVHYEIRKNGKRIDPETASAGSVGGGAGRWRGTVMQALRMNGLPTTPAYANAWLRQIQSESGGNPRAVQGNIGDINNRTGDLAKGLVQVIGSTFRAYSFPGHKNRLNPLDSLLAGMNYAKSRYGVKGMLRKIGHGHGYANGGLVRNHQMAEIAEGNKPEMVIPLTKKARAVQLIQKAQDILGMSEEQRQSSQSNGQDIEMYRLMKEQNNLLKALLEKKADIYMDREKVGYATAPVIDRINGRNIQNAEGRVLT